MTCSILLIFELIVAVAVSVQSQPPRALLVHSHLTFAVHESS